MSQNFRNFLFPKNVPPFNVTFLDLHRVYTSPCPSSASPLSRNSSGAITWQCAAICLKISIHDQFAIIAIGNADLTA